MAHSASLVLFAQVNPIAETSDGALIAADAKLGFDDNAGFRQKDLFAMKDESQEDPRQANASAGAPSACSRLLGEPHRS